MATINVSGQVITVPEGATIQQAMSAAGMHPDSYLFLIGGSPVPMDSVPPADAEVRAMRVASGG